MRIGAKCVRVRENMLENIVFPVILFLISFYDFNLGIDVTDAGYSIHYFEFFEDYSGADMIATFWSNILGHLFCQLPKGDTWYGLSFYCTFIITLSVLSAYFFLKKYMDYRLVAICEVLALFFCWNPNVILYDYLSFLLFQIGIILVFKGIESKKEVWYFFSGFILGLNVFVRIPNLTHCAAIVLVWFADWKNGEKIKKIILDTLVCMTSYVLGVFFSVVTILQIYDFYELRMAVYRLSHTAQTVENYGIFYMATATLVEVFKYWKYILILILLILFVTVLYKIVNKKQEVCIKVKIGVFVLVLILFIYWARSERLFYYEYKWLDSISGLACIFLLWGFVVSLCNFFLTVELEDRLLALTYIGILYVTPLGSNNNIYLVIMNMFLLIPLGIYQIRLWGKLISKIKSDREDYRVVFVQIYRVVIRSVGCIMLIQTVFFGVKYVYKDTDECTVTDSNRICGMHTSNERKEELQELITYFEEESLSGEYGILYCNAPGLAYILDLKPVLSSMWADWYTYSYDDFFVGIQKAEQLIVSDIEPVLLLSNLYSYYIEGNIQEMEKQGMNLYEVAKDDKYFRLVRFIEDNNYECSFRSKNYAVYRIKK